MAAKRGTNTREYKLVRSNFGDITSGIIADLVPFATKAFEKTLIGDTALSDAKNTSKPEYDRASTLLQRLLQRIELDAAAFDTVLSISQSMPSLGQVTRILQGEQPPQEATTNGSSQASGSGISASVASRLQERPSNADALKALLSIADKWEQIGTLLGVPSGRLDGIHNWTRRDADALLKMIAEWLKMPGATWKALLDSVKAIDPLKATEIERDFICNSQ